MILSRFSATTIIVLLCYTWNLCSTTLNSLQPNDLMRNISFNNQKTFPIERRFQTNYQQNQNLTKQYVKARAFSCIILLAEYGGDSIYSVLL